jgi:glutathione S-transferase
MKLYYFPVAPNPTRVLVFVREKGIDIDTEFVDLRQR